MKLPNNHAAETTNIESTVVAASFSSYLMEIYVGTPPVKQMMSVDTGASMSWIQCLPCEHCYHQTVPVFNPYQSSSYQILGDYEHECMLLDDKRDFTKLNGICNYAICFLDGKFSYGVLGKETYTVGGTSIQHIALGCGHNNVGQYEQQSSGMIGLGDGPLSFIGQANAYIHGRFTYCLVSDQFGSNPNARSKISFGHSLDGPISTRLLKIPGQSHYFITLKSIIVGDTIIQLRRESGNLLMDTGSTLTFFPTYVIEKLMDALRRRINKRPIDVPNELCYEINTNIPTITLQFANGAKLALSKKNTFIIYAGNWLCLAMKEDNVLSVLGNRAQIDFSIGYNIPAEMVSFDPTDCSTHIMP
ncbi:aspartic proteinase CDR1-like [Impatiens glandulifera]|uniref:aspartic proteinase CDR1-like n=1 Tax=Impatiens glandulifera TaxID=253017 RepID=UPI001FB150CD|nr:aspartic proteinase CDR1-like [Impatiens glandulifera]